MNAWLESLKSCTSAKVGASAMITNITYEGAPEIVRNSQRKHYKSEQVVGDGAWLKAKLWTADVDGSDRGESDCDNDCQVCRNGEVEPGTWSRR